jgi:hypothetical protein
MGKRFSSTIRIIAALFLSVFTTNLAPVMTAYADPPGNNGTLKVHELGTPSNSESNDPKVCIFNFEAFDLDANQTGNVTIETQSGTPVITPVTVSLTTDAGGDGQTEYINNTNSAVTLANGHYKATLDNKFGTDPGNKAKSKVFKVECAAPDTPVTPTAPTNVDQCGTANDTYTIPTTTGVTYKVNGVTTAANTYPGSGTVNITAEADSGYTLGNATASWSFTFDSTACPITVTPTAPSHVDVCSNSNDTYTIPTATGVTYKVNGVVTPAGTYYIWMNPGVTSYAVTAEPTGSPYVLTGPTSWAFNFTNTRCDAVEVNAQEACVDKHANDGEFTVDVNNYSDMEIYYVVLVDGGNDYDSAYVPAHSSHTFTFSGYASGTYDIDVIKITANVPLPLIMLIPNDFVQRMLNQEPFPALNFKDAYNGSVTLDKCPCDHDEEPCDSCECTDTCEEEPTNPGNGGGQVLGDSTGHTSSTSTNVPNVLPAILPNTGSPLAVNTLLPLAGGFLTYLVIRRKTARK